jgi:hypothetical protein
MAKITRFYHLMSQKTDLSFINDGDCPPMFECLISRTKRGDIACRGLLRTAMTLLQTATGC